MKKLTILLLLVVAGTTFNVSGKSKEAAAYEKESMYDFAKTVEMIRQSANKAGWAIPAEHDMQAILSKKGKEVLPSTIIVLCNANFAYQLLKNDKTRNAQTLLPCRVAVYEKSNGKTYIAWGNYQKAGTDFDESAESVFNDIQAGLKEIVKVVLY